MYSIKQKIRGDSFDRQIYCRTCNTHVKTKGKEIDLICEDYFYFYIICPTCYHHIWVSSHLVSRETRDRLHKKFRDKRELQQCIAIFIAIILWFTVVWLFAEIFNLIIS